LLRDFFGMPQNTFLFGRKFGRLIKEKFFCHTNFANFLRIFEFERTRKFCRKL